MLDLYQFHTNPESLEQRVVKHQSLDKVYGFIKDMFTIFYERESFKLEWTHDNVDNTEIYIELIMEINGEYKHGMIKILYQHNEARVITSIRGSMITRAYGYTNNELNTEDVFTAVHRFINKLKTS